MRETTGIDYSLQTFGVKLSKKIMYYVERVKKYKQSCFYYVFIEI